MTQLSIVNGPSPPIGILSALKSGSARDRPISSCDDPSIRPFPEAVSASSSMLLPLDALRLD